ncbi:type IV pilus assembly protein PilA [Aneurinibacillus soli]|uniref:Type II secretion system protein G n=1 Tax=Aneurinibacillus soli TaxID=1500254 RepID=A0A0U5B7S0_9BACL|nr:prepilin-type N-terminal cleavage/methylation domain-containing protein [Aneurinibacillus soli]PYE62425.1 type IV pilus assembly protein PilA [Aneurinibacillus soli]BAU26988.1 Type II secretion system protein G precursor [Aneurinibacillus soli]
MFKRLREDQKGLTLIELLAVVVILGIILAIAIPSISGIIEKQKAKAHQSNALMILDAAKLYYIDHPDQTTNASGVTATVLVQNRCLEDIPKNPFTGNGYNGNNIVVVYNNGNPQITLSTEVSNNPNPDAKEYNQFTRSQVLGVADNK